MALVVLSMDRDQDLATALTFQLSCGHHWYSNCFEGVGMTMRLESLG